MSTQISHQLAVTTKLLPKDENKRALVHDRGNRLKSSLCREDASLGDGNASVEMADDNRLISWILQGGVGTSAGIILLGLLLLFLRPPLNLFAFPDTLGQVFEGLRLWQPQAVIMLGILVLIVTPILRVAASVLVFARERDCTYVVITLIVLTILISSLLIGQGSTTNNYSLNAAIHMGNNGRDQSGPYKTINQGSVSSQKEGNNGRDESGPYKTINQGSVSSQKEGNNGRDESGPYKVINQGSVSSQKELSILPLVFFASIIAGLLGSLIGLGGGVLLVPVLTLGFGLPISFAIGVSIISVIATSSGAAAAYVRDRLTNMRVGMFLELATTTGAIGGAFLASLLAPNLLAIIFGGILLISAIPLVFKLGEELPRNVKNDRWAHWLHLASSYPDRYLGREIAYQVTRTPLGLAMMAIAGFISGLLGIGSGTFKVIALDLFMRLPMKVSTTTSNFMIGVTAAASAGIYFLRGDIPPLIAAPVALGILIGALLGARLLLRISSKSLRLIFLPIIAIAAVEMILHGLGIG